MSQTSERGALEYAFRLLSHRPRTLSEMRGRLIGRGCDPGLAEGVVESLRGWGYLDDGAYAEQFVEERMRSRQVGQRYLLWHLCRRGVDEELAHEVVERLVPPERELEAARAVVERLSPSDDNSRLRAYRVLLRRGFSRRLARTAMDVDGEQDDS